MEKSEHLSKSNHLVGKAIITREMFIHTDLFNIDPLKKEKLNVNF